MDFDRVVAEHRRELLAHCYRMLGSLHDAEDALQETLVAAWRGAERFEGRSSVRTWLYRIATHACIRIAERRRPRVLSPEYGPSRRSTDDLGEVVTEQVFIEPWVEEPVEDRYLRREAVELAFVAALQHLPANQRAVLILREVLEFSAAEVADLLDTSTASVNSALQRARKAVDERVSGPPQRDELAALGDDGCRELVDAFVSAWERADIPDLVGLLARDARFTMPPLPAWFDGIDAVEGFLTDRLFASSWRLTPLTANGQLGFACYQRAVAGGAYALSAVNVLTVRDGRIAEITGFIDPAVLRFLEFLPAHR
ncbi:RNA polymerase subunit sigma-70 [Asanoa sp. NPDC050611]|uniref:RNA polymerase subunit sigma-70 n=1 Tax=Asanoa sp. NPDC050611 TaxID=3157098 RepID=UPI0033D4CF18